MNKNEAENHLKQIKETMDFSKKAAAGNSGWLLILWGVIWIIGFSGFQISLKVGAVTWPVFGILGMIISIILGNHFFGKKGKLPSDKFGKKSGISAFSLGIFIMLIIIQLKIYHPKDIISLIIMGNGLLFMLSGLLGNFGNRSFLLGIILLINGFIAGLLFDTFFFLYVALTCGCIMIISGIVVLYDKTGKDVINKE